MRILLVAHEVPYPPVHGGRMDTWNRIVALSRVGVSIDLVRWVDEAVVCDHLDRIREHVDSVTLYARNRVSLKAMHHY